LSDLSHPIMSLLRRRKPPDSDKNRAAVPHESDEDFIKGNKATPVPVPNSVRLGKARRSCLDSCCWWIGFVCSSWWFLLFLYNAMPASFPQYVTEAITGPLPDPPGVKLQKEGLRAKHPVVFVPGIVTGGLELWEGHQCAEGLFRKRLWGGTFGEVYKRYGINLGFVSVA
jgi:phospholipid:diacylglycerol acyltransferase